MSTIRRNMVGLLQQQAGNQRENESDAEEEEVVAEGEDEGLLLDGPADRHDRLMRRCGAIPDQATWTAMDKWCEVATRQNHRLIAWPECWLATFSSRPTRRAAPWSP